MMSPRNVTILIVQVSILVSLVDAVVGGTYWEYAGRPPFYIENWGIFTRRGAFSTIHLKIIKNAILLAPIFYVAVFAFKIRYTTAFATCLFTHVLIASILCFAWGCYVDFQQREIALFRDELHFALSLSAYFGVYILARKFYRNASK